MSPWKPALTLTLGLSLENRGGLCLWVPAFRAVQVGNQVGPRPAGFIMARQCSSGGPGEKSWPHCVYSGI